MQYSDMPKAKDRRAAKRHSVDLAAQVSQKESEQTIDCVVRNACGSGCMIVSDQISALADSDVHLQITGFPSPKRGKMIWRRGNEAGVRFI